MKFKKKYIGSWCGYVKFKGRGHEFHWDTKEWALPLYFSNHPYLIFLHFLCFSLIYHKK